MGVGHTAGRGRERVHAMRRAVAVVGGVIDIPAPLEHGQFGSPDAVRAGAGRGTTQTTVGRAAASPVSAVAAAMVMARSSRLCARYESPPWRTTWGSWPCGRMGLSRCATVSAARVVSARSSGGPDARSPRRRCAGRRSREYGDPCARGRSPARSGSRPARRNRALCQPARPPCQTRSRPCEALDPPTANRLPCRATGICPPVAPRLHPSSPWLLPAVPVPTRHHAAGLPGSLWPVPETVLRGRRRRYGSCVACTPAPRAARASWAGEARRSRRLS